MCPKPRIPFFWFTSIWVLKRPVLVEVSAPTRLGLWGSNVQRKFRKQTTLSSKSSTLKGLLYAPILQKQYHKRTTLRRLKIPLQSIVARKVRTIALERSAKKAVMRHAINAIYGMGTLKIPLQSIRSEEAPHYPLGAKRKEAVRRQATINLFTSLDILWWFHARAVLHSLADARKCQLEDFCEKERYESCSVQWTFTADAFRKVQKGETLPVVKLLPGSHERLALRNPRVLFQKHGGACTMY
jgi:hypothetical protein